MAALSGATPARIDRPADRAELILSQLEQLPTLPSVAVRVLQAANSPDSGAADLAALIETDQALTAKVLSLVRRAHLGAGREITTVAQAVVMLGFAAIRNAVLSVQVYEMFAAAEPGDESALDRTEFWKHSLAVACAAQLIARRSGNGVCPDEAFVCGLLHDLGKVALDACLPKSYARIVRETRTRRACICDVERAVLGLDHTVAGKRLARRWKLPEAAVECIWLHHQPPESLPSSVGGADLVEVVHLADHLVRRQRIGYSGYNTVGDVDRLGGRLGLDTESLTEIVVELGPLVEQHCDLFGLGSLTSSEMYARALVEANEELGKLNVTLTEANRRLQMRSACFEALRRFHESLRPDGTLTDVCRAAAVCLRRALELDSQAVCFSLNDSGTVCHVGTTGGDGRSGTVLMLESPVAELPAPAAGRLMSPPESAQPVCERFGDLLADGAAWMLPAVHAGRMVGGVLFTAPAELVDRLRSYPDELEALSGAFGLAIETAVVRAGSEALLEELADVNRRLHAAQEELLHTKSLSMIAAMAAGAAHELNNPLAVISGRAQMLAAQADDEQRRSLLAIHEHAQRASNIVSELLDFAKPDPPRAELISLLPWFEQFRARWLAISSPDPEQFHLAINDPALTIRADPDQLTRIFDALTANASEAATPENARLVVNSASRASDDTVVVSVEDNGCGMAAEVLDHALDPFFSHRPAGRGRGLGLSQAHSLAVSNGGRLWLESTPGVGTTAFVELPAARTA